MKKAVADKREAVVVVVVASVTRVEVQRVCACVVFFCAAPDMCDEYFSYVCLCVCVHVRASDVR